ncbi:MAG: MATE family efflux transporter [Rubripirellula sp.]
MSHQVTFAAEPSTRQPESVLREVLRIALPLVVSTGTFSVVLFMDRTMLLWYDGASMSAAMAGGNLFWVCLCLPIGILSMTGAVISQHIGANQEKQVGRLLWQGIWLSLLVSPFYFAFGTIAPKLFSVTGQAIDLIPLQADYFRILMFGSTGMLIETALSGFFSGTERTRVIMWVSLMSGLVNLILDSVLIFGFGPIADFGIHGAAVASVLSLWFKACCYAWLLTRRRTSDRYQILGGFGIDGKVLRRLLYFGFPAGLMHLVESGGFTAMMLRIGTFGDLPLRSTTMAINFNMVAFIPLVGLSIASSVLVGRHLIANGPAAAIKRVMVAVGIGLVYSSAWLIAYLFFGENLLEFYQLKTPDSDSIQAVVIAKTLLRFVSLYIMFDAVQLILAGALRGAGDTWFVLLAGLTTSASAIGIGFTFEPSENQLYWWWYVLSGWIMTLAFVMILRFLQGRWKSMQMIETS